MRRFTMRWMTLLTMLVTLACGVTLATAAPSLAASASPSEVATEPANVTSSSSALLRGELNPDGLPTTYYFEYSAGTCDESAHCVVQTAVAGPVSGEAQQEAPAVEVTGLAPDRTYAYRLVATNADGTEAGEFVTFTTLSAGDMSGQEPTAVTTPLAQLLAPSSVGVPTKGVATSTPTRAQRLAKALRACQEKSKRLRAACDRQAREKYGIGTGKAAKHLSKNVK